MKEESIRLRAHHGMCLAFFEGKGYSEGFTRHMQEVLDGMAADPLLELVTEGDIVCRECPNLQNGVCATPGKVLRYDTRVLELCGLKVHDQLHWSDFSRRICEAVLKPKVRETVCFDCEWNAVCKARESNPNF